LARPTYDSGAYVRNCSLPSPAEPTRAPFILLPVISTLTTLPSSTRSRNVENGISAGGVRNVWEKFQISTPTTTSTIQNSRLLRVEFNLGLLTALLSRISRLAKAP
jgi:hypothetical protein